MKSPERTALRVLLFAVSYIAAAAALTGCHGGKVKPSARSAKPVVAVSILPQRYFLERIGGDRIEPLVLVGNGQNPHSYEPTPGQMRDLATAKAWILSGTDFEIALEPKIAAQFPGLSIVDGTAGVTFRALQAWESEPEEESRDGGEESAGDGDGHHEHESNIDRHSWLGSGPAKILAGHIRDALVAVDPEGAPAYTRNHDELVREIDEVYASLRASLSPLSGRKVMVFHPAFGYFLDEFGIRQESVETGGKEPTARALADLIAKAKADKPGAIFVQAQFPVNAAETVAREVGASVVALDPLDPDWLGNITRMGEALKNELGREGQ